MGEREELRKIFEYLSERFCRASIEGQLNIVDRMVEIYKILYSKEYEYRARVCATNTDGRPKASATAQEASGNAVNADKIVGEIVDKLCNKLSATAQGVSR